MKHLKIVLLILAFSLASVIATQSFYRWRLSQSAEKQVIVSQHEALAKLESAQGNLKVLLAQNQKLQEALEKELASEKERFSELQQRFWEVISQNKALIKKVLLYRVEEQRERELQQKLQENIRKNQELGQQLLALKKKIEEDSARASAAPSVVQAQAEAAPQRTEELEKRIAWLKTKEELNQVELNRRQEKIQTLQEKIQGMEEKLSLALEQFKEMERDSALLRERNVALQIERETLIADLNRARGELAQLQERLAQIGELLVSQKITDAPQAEGGTSGIPLTGKAVSGGGGKKVDVEFLNLKTGTGK